MERLETNHLKTIHSKLLTLFKIGIFSSVAFFLAACMLLALMGALFRNEKLFHLAPPLSSLFMILTAFCLLLRQIIEAVLVVIEIRLKQTTLRSGISGVFFACMILIFAAGAIYALAWWGIGYYLKYF